MGAGVWRVVLNIVPCLVLFGAMLVFAPKLRAQDELYAPPPVHNMADVCIGLSNSTATFSDRSARSARSSPRRSNRGMVMLDCTLGANGRLAACSAIIESPANAGLGAEAMRVVCDLRLVEDLATRQVRTVDGGKIVESYVDDTDRTHVRLEFDFQ